MSSSPQEAHVGEQDSSELDQIPRPLAVDAAAIQRRNQIAADLLSYYEFLIAMYLPDNVLKRPPEDGWAFVTAERFAFLNKTYAVIDLYNHIPYISQDFEEEYQIYMQTICLDYTGHNFEHMNLSRQNGELGPPQYYDGMDGIAT